MRRVKKLNNEQQYIKAREILRIANEAVFKAKKENKRLGIPEYFMKNGQLYFVLPSGKITTRVPAIMKRAKPLE